MTVRRDTARAVLFDADGWLVLIRRVRRGVAPYLVTPGGALEPGEDTATAVARECAEEVGAVVSVGPVVIQSPADPRGVATFHLCVVEEFDLALRTGHELSEARRGSYETVRVPWDDRAGLATLKPAELRDVLAEHGAQWAAWAATAYET